MSESWIWKTSMSKCAGSEQYKVIPRILQTIGSANGTTNKAKCAFHGCAMTSCITYAIEQLMVPRGVSYTVIIGKDRRDARCPVVEEIVRFEWRIQERIIVEIDELFRKAFNAVYENLNSAAVE